MNEFMVELSIEHGCNTTIMFFITIAIACRDEPEGVCYEGKPASVDYNPCDCTPKEEPAQKADAPPSAAQLAKKGTIASDAGKNAAAPDAIRASVLARAKAGSVKK